ncbi:MAG: Nif3-like dinuclear metal center hexameric protein [Cyclobacteriaceae bacterium]|jgi:dinuclear metal center YbgI/SA1388 family protein|nr:Nif3-like dinuclear metal center hexameric protein [Cyclobacteriaceae bacterium]
MAEAIASILSHLEAWAPLAYQEDYDNCGLITGNPSWPVTGILVSLDCTEAVVEEARQQGSNLIVAHHPIVFRALKKITGKTYGERAVLQAIKHDIALYAIHTNLDHIHTGVNKKIADRLGLQNARILQPNTRSLSKLVTFIPNDQAAQVMAALYAAGAGAVGRYAECSFQVQGVGTFTPSAQANPAIGQRGVAERVNETRAEVIFPSHLSHRVMAALRAAHPYEEVAYYLTELKNENQEVGAGMIGELAAPEEPFAFLRRLKNVMQTGCVRHTAVVGTEVRKVAVCGGAGSFLLPAAIAQGADVFISADFKYHEFFDAEGKITVADIGHYESEQFTKDLLVEVLSKKFPTFAVNFSKTVTNPISYL